MPNTKALKISETQPIRLLVEQLTLAWTVLCQGKEEQFFCTKKSLDYGESVYVLGMEEGLGMECCYLKVENGIYINNWPNMGRDWLEKQIYSKWWEPCYSKTVELQRVENILNHMVLKWN